MADGEGLGAGEADGLGDGDGLPEGAGLTEGEAAGDELGLALGVELGVGLALGDGDGLGLGEGGGGVARSTGSVRISKKPDGCFVTVVLAKPSSAKTAWTWSAVTFGSANRMTQRVPPV